MISSTHAGSMAGQAIPHCGHGDRFIRGQPMTLGPEDLFNDEDRRFMDAALEEARTAAEQGEVPVGCVIVRDGQIIGSSRNSRQRSGDPAGHAEILALRSAGELVGDWRLEGCTLYVTLEPCPMCVSACRQARLDLVIWGTPDPTLGACGTVIDLAEDPRLGPLLAQRGGLAEEECRHLLQSFFTNTRISS